MTRHMLRVVACTITVIATSVVLSRGQAPLRPTAVIQQPENTLLGVTLESGETCAVFCLTELERIVDQYRQFGGEFVFTAPPGRYVVLVYGGQRPRPPTLVDITPRAPGPAPTPPAPTPPEPQPPQPDIPLTGLAREVYERCRTMEGASELRKGVTAFRAAATGIQHAMEWQSAGTQAARQAVPEPKYFTTALAAKATLEALKAAKLPPTTEPLWQWLFDERLNALRTKLDATRDAYNAIADGLEAASKGTAAP